MKVIFKLVRILGTAYNVHTLIIAGPCPQIHGCPPIATFIAHGRYSCFWRELKNFRITLGNIKIAA